MNPLSKRWPLSYVSGSLLAASLLLTACNSDSNASNPPPTPTPEPTPITNDWHQKVVYQVFVRSFYDSDGDGTGDLAGVTEKLDYLQDLGVDALWLMPIQPSPTYHGYGVSDYTSINPDYGTLDDFSTLIREAHKRHGVEIAGTQCNAVGHAAGCGFCPGHVQHRRKVAQRDMQLRQKAGLAGCGKANKAKPNDGGDPPVKASVDALKQGQPAADSEETVDGAESLARVRGDLEYDGRLTGAAAYLGLREKGDQTELTDWLRENCADLTSKLPFLLEIPSERVLGAGYGKLFCIVPRDENTSLAVNHVTWQMMGNGLHPVADEVLYREEYAEPVLVFVDPEEPDKEVNLVTNDGVAALW